MGIFDRIDRLADQLGDLIVPDDVRQHVELGAGFLERGDLPAAIHELALAVELRPDHPRANYLLGVAHARNGDVAVAIESLGHAAERGLAAAHMALGELYRQQGDFEAAAGAYRAALDGDVADATLRGEIYRGLGAVYMAMHRYDKAVRELRKAAASLPGDAESQGLLGRALYLRGDLDGARVSLERAADRARPDAGVLVALGEVYQRLARSDDAEAAFRRAVEAGGDAEVGARLGLAKVALAAGQTATAHEQVMRALALEPGRPDILVMQARVMAAAASPDGALAAFDRALAAGEASVSARGPRLLFDRRPVLEEALRVVLGAGLYARAASYAAPLAAIDPEHPLALAAAALAALDAGDPAAAQPLAERALAAADNVETRLAVAAVAERCGNLPQAAASLRRAAQLAPSDARPRARLAALYRSEHAAAPPDLYALLKQAHRHFARCRELAELSPDAGRLVEVLDRPLLVTVMGEFNSGKSTFVNALLGEEVAPMGIVPTTATINILKYGAERGGRVIYQDDRVRDVAWAEIPALLRGLDAAEARRIRVVEVLYPLETLQRVNVVDTPGLNSIHPEHEVTARRFIAEADAVIWLFSVDQAAKATEGSALVQIRAEGKKVLGVLNKVDRCSADELAQILAHIGTALGEHLEVVVPVSAKQALAARKTGDAAELTASHYPELAAALEERFFSRARAIQRAACRARLGALLDRATERGVALTDPARLDGIAAALAAVRGEALLFERTFLPAERLRLAEAAEGVWAACAREVLDFVRPRRWAFGSNEAAPADRDFLLGLLEERLGAMLDASRARVDEQVVRAVAAARSVDADVDPVVELKLRDEQVYGRFRAFARGYLRGGRVDDFFTRVLPKLELTEREIRRALERNGPYTDEIAETDLRAPLCAWAAQFHATLAARLERARTAAELELFDIEERVLSPVEQLRAALAALAA